MTLQQREMFGRDPSGNKVPIKVDADGNLSTVPSGGGEATTIANGADVALGSTTDVAVSTDANGTASAKLRGLIVLMVNLLSRWPASLGQQTRAASLSFTHASDAIGANAPQMQGTAADGAAVVGNPVLVGGFDGTLAQTFLSSPAGRQQITSGQPFTDGLTQATMYDSADAQRALAVGLNVFNGANLERQRMANLSKGFDAVDIATEVAILTPTNGKKLRILGLVLSSSVAGNIVLREGTAGTILAVVPSGAGGGAGFIPLGNGKLFAAINTSLTADGPVAGLMSGTITYVEE